MYVGIHGKCVLFLSALSFLYQFLRNTQISDFMKMRPVTAKLFDADRWTDMTKLIVSFWKFVNTPKNRNYGMDFEFCGLNNTLHSCMAIWIVKISFT